MLWASLIWASNSLSSALSATRSSKSGRLRSVFAKAVLRRQLVVGALFTDYAVFQHIDPVTALGHGHALGNDHRGFSHQDTGQRLLNTVFNLRVQRRGAIIQ